MTVLLGVMLGWGLLSQMMKNQTLRQFEGRGFRIVATITKRCGVYLFTAQKSVSRPGWWKGKFTSFQVVAIWREGGYLSQG